MLIELDVHQLYLTEVRDLAKRLNPFGPVSYQDHLYALAKHHNVQVAVETGTRFGVATAMLKLAGVGTIYSCDPRWVSSSQAYETIAELTGVQLSKVARIYPTTSRHVLPDIPTPWDMFVHDSDHSADNMAWELTFAWSRVKSGGIIVCDDWETCMHAEKHDVVPKFLALHGITDTMEIGSALAWRKP